MTSALGYACCVLTLITAAGKVRSARGGPMSTSRKYLISAIAAFGLGLAFSAPATLAHLATLEPIPRLTANVLAMIAAFCVLAMLDYSTSDRKTRTKLTRAHAIGLVFCVAAMAPLLVAADVQHTREFTTSYGRDPLIVAYLCLYLAYMSWSLSRFIWLVRRYTDASEAYPLIRRGFRITVLGACIGMVCVIWKAAGSISLGVADRALPWQAALSQILPVVAIAVAATGSTYTSWAPGLRNLRERWQVWTATRALRQLWCELIEALPHVQFVGDPRISLSTLTRTERGEYRLYRRTLEIRDAQLALRPYIPPEATGWAHEATQSQQLSSSATDVLLEAVELATALDAHHAGQRHRPEPTDTATTTRHAPSAPNLLTEARWLIRVSTAMRPGHRVAPTPRPHPG
jgi:hypothetical protein